MFVEIRWVNSHRGCGELQLTTWASYTREKKSFSCKRICKASPGPPACSLDYLKCVFNKIKWNFNQLKCVEKAIVKSVGILWMQRLPCPPSTYHGPMAKKKESIRYVLPALSARIAYSLFTLLKPVSTFFFFFGIQSLLLFFKTSARLNPINTILSCFLVKVLVELGNLIVWTMFVPDSVFKVLKQI